MNRSAAFERVRERAQGLSTRDRRALMVGAIILAPVLAWSGIIRPYMSTTEAWADRLNAEQSLLERERLMLEDAPRFGSLLKEAKGALRDWDDRFLRAPNPAIAEAEVIAMLESAARRNRVLLQELSAAGVPAGEQPPADLHPIRMSIRGESDYEGVLGFLAALEESRTLFRIIGVSMDRRASQSDQGAQVGAMSFVVIVEAYASLEP